VLYGWVERVVGSCTSHSHLAICAHLDSRINPSTGVIMKEYSPAHEYVALLCWRKSKLTS